VTALPIAPGLTHVATLEREIGASIERIWENVLDWEHLPHLHAGSFDRIEKLELGEWGWRARAATSRKPDSPLVIEVGLERAARRYVSRTLEGEGAGSEIWTVLEPRSDDRTGIHVEFWAPGVPESMKDELGASYIALYQRLWDEDEAMMRMREARLRERAGRATRTLPQTHSLGSLSELQGRVPMVVDTPRGRQRILQQDGGGWIVHAAVCPHLLGPLEDVVRQEGGEPCEGEVRCPWHGYRFDVRSGRSSDGRRLRLPEPPRLEVDAERDLAWLHWPGED
jgi:nitrite reductase/ring-hydroxylating ferredoxin subunit